MPPKSRKGKGTDAVETKKVSAVYELLNQRDTLRNEPAAETYGRTATATAKKRRKVYLTDKEIDVYLGTHLQGALLKKTKTIRNKLAKKGLIEPTYESQAENYKIVIAKTFAVTQGLHMMYIGSKLDELIDKKRVEAVGSFKCCSETEAESKIGEELVSCVDPLCEIGQYHASCLWQIEMDNYECFARLEEGNPLKGKWMCSACVALRAKGGFPEWPILLAELKRSEDSLRWNPVAAITDGKGCPPVQV